ncbi:MAG: hypothetical protein ACK461_04385 [Bacteroidota bacterium]
MLKSTNKIIYNIICFCFLALFTLSFTKRKNVPETNHKIISFVKGVTGKKVGKGECWDLAAGALNAAGAKWTPPYAFGKLVDYKKEEIIPGDIIQISNIVMESRSDNAITRWKMVQHTAILFEIGIKGSVQVAEQNVNDVRKVMISTWNLNDIKSGRMQFYRPQP